MPQFGAVGFSTPNSNSAAKTPSTAVGVNQILPSPSIWGSCDCQSLLDNPDGFWVAKDWKGVLTLPDLQKQNGTYSYDTATDSAMNVAYTSTNTVAFFTMPMVPIAQNGATKTWFEVSINVKQSTAQSIFIGLATSTGLSSTLHATSTTLLSTAGLIGFYMHADALGQFDAVYQKPLNISSTSTTTITVLASTLTAGSNNSDPGNPFFVPATPPGALTGSQGYIKLGVRTDKVYAYWYVNGTLVAKQAIDATFDTADSYGGVCALTTGTANSDNAVFSFYRHAARMS